MRAGVLLIFSLMMSCAAGESSPAVSTRDTGAAIVDSGVVDSTVPTMDSAMPSGETATDTTVAPDTMTDTTVVDSTMATEAAPDADVAADTGVLPATWTTDTKVHSCTIGARYTYLCPPGGMASTVWGSGPYTDDSSLCTAAVHAGVITLATGGLVTIEVRAGESSYSSSTANGITTTSYGTWSCSFVVVGAKLDGGVSDAPIDTGGETGPPMASWSTNAKAHECKIGETFSYVCPPGGTASTVWGSGPYTHDSSICTAAVHAGRITLAAGGTIAIEMRAGESAYTGTTANGITTLDYGSWTCSFVVL